MDMTQRSIWTLPIPLHTRTPEGCRDEQFSSRWYLRARKSPYAPHPVPQIVFPTLFLKRFQCSSFQGRSSSAYCFHVRLSGVGVTRGIALLAAVSLGWRKKIDACGDAGSLFRSPVTAEGEGGRVERRYRGVQSFLIGRMRTLFAWPQGDAVYYLSAPARSGSGQRD